MSQSKIRAVRPTTLSRVPTGYVVGMKAAAGDAGLSQPFQVETLIRTISPEACRGVHGSSTSTSTWGNPSALSEWPTTLPTKATKDASKYGRVAPAGPATRGNGAGGLHAKEAAYGVAASRAARAARVISTSMEAQDESGPDAGAL